MGLDISAYSHLRLVSKGVPEDFEWTDEQIAIHEVGDGIDRLDGLPPGVYARTLDIHLWWHAEHGTYDIPASEAAAIAERVARLQAGEARRECPGDLAVLDEARPLSRAVGFRAGSYSGYNWWREQLCKFALDAVPNDVWGDPEHYEGRPFVELINFSDCDGSIGATTAAKLLDDFEAYADQVVGWAASAITDDDERSYFLESYGEWQNAFAIASDHGFLIFH